MLFSSDYELPQTAFVPHSTLDLPKQREALGSGSSDCVRMVGHSSPTFWWNLDSAQNPNLKK